MSDLIDRHGLLRLWVNLQASEVARGGQANVGDLLELIDNFPAAPSPALTREAQLETLLDEATKEYFEAWEGVREWFQYAAQSKATEVNLDPAWADGYRQGWTAARTLLGTKVAPKFLEYAALSKTPPPTEEERA